MFGKFGGIVIIALSGAIIAGLILRPTPDLPPAMNIGVPENTSALVNTLETTIDNQDKKPAAIEPVTDTVDSIEKKQKSSNGLEQKATNMKKQPQADSDETTPSETKSEPDQEASTDDKTEGSQKTE